MCYMHLSKMFCFTLISADGIKDFMGLKAPFIPPAPFFFDTGAFEATQA